MDTVRTTIEMALKKVLEEHGVAIDEIRVRWFDASTNSDPGRIVQTIEIQGRAIR